MTSITIPTPSLSDALIGFVLAITTAWTIWQHYKHMMHDKNIDEIRIHIGKKKKKN